MTGQQVAMLTNAYLQAGNHQTILASDRMPAGVYLLKLVYNGKIITKKLLKK
jgi:uncharacterized protein YegP (UPF0339 family)